MIVAESSKELSVILVNWNARDFLLLCLESVYQSLGRLDMEVFVIDNGSADGSGSAVRERFPEVCLVENPTNLGFGKANNQALARSKGKYLLLLNPDTLLREGAVDRLLSFMDRHPEAGVAGPQLLNPDGSKQNAIANFPSLATELLNKSLLRWLLPGTFPGKERKYTEPLEVDSVIGACMLVRRDAVRQAGLLDEDYFLFLEETDWCYQMKKGGWKIYHVPHSEVYHFQGQSAKTEKAKAKLEYYRSRYHFFKKNRGRLPSLLLLVGLVARLSFELVLMAVLCSLTLFTVRRWREKLSVYAYLMGWHLRGCPEGMGLKPKSQDA